MKKKTLSQYGFLCRFLKNIWVYCAGFKKYYKKYVDDLFGEIYILGFIPFLHPTSKEKLYIRENKLIHIFF